MNSSQEQSTRSHRFTKIYRLQNESLRAKVTYDLRIPEDVKPNKVKYFLKHLDVLPNERNTIEGKVEMWVGNVPANARSAFRRLMEILQTVSQSDC